MKQVAGQLRLDLAQYRELAAFAQFAADLDRSTRDRLERGQRMTEILKQPQYEPVPVGKQIIQIFAGARGFLDDIAIERVAEFERSLVRFMDQNHADIEKRSWSKARSLRRQKRGYVRLSKTSRRATLDERAGVRCAGAGRIRSEGVTEASRTVLGAQGEPSAEPRGPSGASTAYLAERCVPSRTRMAPASVRPHSQGSRRCLVFATSVGGSGVSRTLRRSRKRWSWLLPPGCDGRRSECSTRGLMRMRFARSWLS